MPQSATLAYFRPPIPAISHFDVLGFNPDTFENLSKTFKISITDSWFSRKNVVSSTYAVYKNSYSKILRPFILFDLVTANTTSKTKMKR